MYLKTIELQGFKSFHGKMVFAFDQGVTAIVGPNGSGKSNVADAVRWVLGEQRAKLLRSSRMQDVIFAGTESRKALSFCEVALTIVNDDKQLPIDYDEVTVTRRVYRSGESEYYINGASCRMRDIHELFMDTGVGREGYSIIGQGQIDKILSNKPEQRRGLFDEAAGIVKYKKRKENALKKLSEEKQNLFRINDIVTELGDRSLSLEKKAAKARQYLELKEELKIREIKNFVDELAKVENDLSKNKEFHKNVKTEIEEISNGLDKNDAQHKSVNEESEKNLENLENLSEEIINLQNQKSEEDKNLSLLGQRVEHLNELMLRHDGEKEQLGKKLETLNTELSEYKKKVADVFIKSEEASKKIEQESKKIEELDKIIADRQDKISSDQSSMIEDLNMLSTLKSERQHFYSTSKSDDDRKKAIMSRKLIIAKSSEEQEKEYSKLLSKKKEYLKEIKDFEDKLNELRSKKSEYISEAETLQSKLQNINASISNKESKQSALYDLIYSYEGFNYSIKKVMELRPKYKNHIYGVITELIEVPNEYERAIEITLGNAYQNIVVSTSEIAKAIIEYLKKNKFGRATFLPLDNIKFYDNRKDLSDIKGFIGYADDLVSFDDKYEDVVKFLLAKTVIVDSLDDALSMRRKHKVNYRMVTLSGEVLNAGGSMTGGAYKTKGNQFLARKREYETLTSDLKTLKKDYKKVTAGANELKSNLLSTNEQIELNKASLKDIREKESDLAILIHKLNTDLLRNKNDLKEINGELELINSGITKHDESIKEISDKIESLGKGIKVLEQSIEDGKNSLLEDSSKRNDLMEALNTIKLESTRLFEQKSNSEQIIERMKLSISEVEDSLVLIDVDNEVYIKEIEQKKDQMTQCELRAKEVDEKILAIRGRQQELQDKKDEFRLKLDEIYNAREDLQKNLSKLEKEELRISNKIEKITKVISDSYDYMWATYELTYSECEVAYKEIDVEFSNIKTEIKELKGKIKLLGDVDVNSIDEYVEVSTRYKFLMEQKEDIEASEAKLEKMIAELDELMISQFKDSFKDINKEFQTVFRSLFGGGKAYLELTDNEDVLEAGIEINVQPPGKKLQSMMLLSGGERAFTAIALLFAILNLKPTPFCVLDEIEAALDDTNVVKFAKYLKKISKTMQFIVITHRRGTMENSDSLYGITMQEKGISKQVSVKLIDTMIE